MNYSYISPTKRQIYSNSIVNRQYISPKSSSYIPYNTFSKAQFNPSIGTISPQAKLYNLRKSNAPLSTSYASNLANLTTKYNQLKNQFSTNDQLIESKIYDLKRSQQLKQERDAAIKSQIYSPARYYNTSLNIASQYKQSAQELDLQYDILKNKQKALQYSKYMESSYQKQFLQNQCETLRQKNTDLEYLLMQKQREQQEIQYLKNLEYKKQIEEKERYKIQQSEYQLDQKNQEINMLQNQLNMFRQENSQILEKLNHLEQRSLEKEVKKSRQRNPIKRPMTNHRKEKIQQLEKTRLLNQLDTITHKLKNSLYQDQKPFK